MKSTILWLLSVAHLSSSQKSGDDKGLLNRRPLSQQSSPCWGGYDGWDSVDEDVKGRKFLLAAGAAVGGAALGYHFGMKNPQNNQPVINNNIYNPPPCVVVQSGGGGGGGLIGGLLGHHPILSNIIQSGVGGGLLGNGGGGVGGSGNRQGGINWNRVIRQFNRVVRPVAGVFF